MEPKRFQFPAQERISFLFFVGFCPTFGPVTRDVSTKNVQVEGKLYDEIKPSASVAKELQKKVTQAEAGKRENLSLIVFCLQ